MSGIQISTLFANLLNVDMFCYFQDGTPDCKAFSRPNTLALLAQFTLRAHLVSVLSFSFYHFRVIIFVLSFSFYHFRFIVVLNFLLSSLEWVKLCNVSGKIQIGLVAFS